MLTKNKELVKEVARALKVTEIQLQALISSLRRGGHGNHRQN